MRPALLALALSMGGSSVLAQVSATRAPLAGPGPGLNLPAGLTPDDVREASADLLRGLDVSDPEKTLASLGSLSELAGKDPAALPRREAARVLSARAVLAVLKDPAPRTADDAASLGRRFGPSFARTLLEARRAVLEAEAMRERDPEQSNHAWGIQAETVKAEALRRLKAAEDGDLVSEARGSLGSLGRGKEGKDFPVGTPGGSGVEPPAAPGPGPEAPAPGAAKPLSRAPEGLSRAAEPLSRPLAELAAPGAAEPLIPGHARPWGKAPAGDGAGISRLDANRESLLVLSGFLADLPTTSKPDSRESLKPVRGTLALSPGARPSRTLSKIRTRLNSLAWGAAAFLLTARQALGQDPVDPIEDPIIIITIKTSLWIHVMAGVGIGMGAALLLIVSWATLKYFRTRKDGWGGWRRLIGWLPATILLVLGLLLGAAGGAGYHFYLD